LGTGARKEAVRESAFDLGGAFSSHAVGHWFEFLGRRAKPLSSTAIPTTKPIEREAIVGTFVLGGPRAIELDHMLWRDIDLAGSRIFIGRSKTAAGLREIEIQPILRDILATYKTIAYRGNPDALVFPTLTGARRDSDNLRTRVLGPTFERADELLAQRGLVPLPKGLTTHKLRHAFASVLIALGEDPVWVMRQIGTSRLMSRRSFESSPNAAVRQVEARCSRRWRRQWPSATATVTSKRCPAARVRVASGS
jgi:integrase